MTEVILGVAMFTGVILALVVLILAARSKLVPQGDLIINVNGEKDLTVSP
jgi:Na+-transporting NADH:ubiquinone oxidoreductase subunit F